MYWFGVQFVSLMSIFSLRTLLVSKKYMYKGVFGLLLVSKFLVVQR